jgi:hypothetical protein
MRLCLLAVACAWVAGTAAASPGPCLPCHAQPPFDAAALSTSIHGRLACVDCHQGYGARPHRAAPPELSAKERVIAARFAAASPAPAAIAVCGRCHESQRDDWMASAHAGATCVQCHGSAHAVAKGLPALARKQQLSARCASCHAQDKSADPIHARALALGNAKAPACADCHGAHDIAKGALAAEAVRTAACTGCHKGANATFAATFSHAPAQARPAPRRTAKWISGLTALTVVALVFQGLGDVRARSRRRSREGLREPPPLRGAARRFDRHQWAQHLLVTASVAALIASALLHAPLVHRAAGVALGAAGVYHVVYAALRRRQAREFSLVERLDRLAFFGATALMFVTGAARWFPVIFARFLPAWALESMRLIHGQALLWLLALFAWHLYLAHVRPPPAEVKP